MGSRLKLTQSTEFFVCTTPFIASSSLPLAILPVLSFQSLTKRSVKFFKYSPSSLSLLSRLPKSPIANHWDPFKLQNLFRSRKNWSNPRSDRFRRKDQELSRTLVISFSNMAVLLKDDSIQIREVWNDNLEEEFALIREIVDDYNYVAMDTEFPGVVSRPVRSFKNINDYNYMTLKDNVDVLKLIQLGLTFSDENGNLPTCGTEKFCIWQFNFREFDVTKDIYASESIELLRQCGIDFQKNMEKGVDVNRFGELLMSSGVVLNGDVSWLTFHSGYDFGYLLKLLTCRALPETQVGFFDLINLYFPVVYDIKHLMRFCNSLHGGLNKLAELLDVERVGVMHQAGSDSLLTSCTFRKLRETFFSGSMEKYTGVLYGLGIENGWSTS